MGLYRSNISGKIVSMSDLGYSYLTNRDQKEFEPYTPVKATIPDVLKEMINTPIQEKPNFPQPKKRGRHAKV